MKISQAGINFIKIFEGFRDVCYLDAIGVKTIGYGHTGKDVDIMAVGDKISEEQATEYLKQDLEKSEKQVNKYNDIYNFNQNQFDALVSFAFNIGNIDQLTDSGKRTIAQISEKILLYKKAGGKTLPGLERRRKEEKIVFDREI